MKSLFGLGFFLTISSFAHAESWYEKKAGDQLLYDMYLKAGVPQAAIQRTFEFLDLNEEKQFEVRLNKSKHVPKTITNKNFAVIIDYSKPSSQRRLFLMNLVTGNVDAYYVAHGVRTGDNFATKFSNEVDSRKSSLGFFLTGSIYIGGHGESLRLFGLEKSNDKAFERDIVMHGAPYISLDFLGKYGRMGRSWGCPAVSRKINKKIVPLVKNGAIFYAYHKDLMPETQTNPIVQDSAPEKPEAAPAGDNVVPEEQNP